MINLLKKHKDKLYHFGICFVASIFQPWLAVGLALGKEVYDWFKYGKSIKDFWKMALGDLLADGLGIVVGTALHILAVAWLLG